MLENYDGYEWGWILIDGTRCPPAESITGEIAGIWGRLFRKDIEKAFYSEMTKPDGTTLEELIAKNLQQCIRFSFPEYYPMSNAVLPAPENTTIKNYRVLQRWKCGECDHTFYTELLPRLTLKAAWHRLRAFDLIVTIECEICKQISCKKNGKVKKEVQS